MRTKNPAFVSGRSSQAAAGSAHSRCFSDFRKRDLMDLLERRSVSSTSVSEYGRDRIDKVSR